MTLTESQTQALENQFGLADRVVDADALARTVERFRERQITLPTFAALAAAGAGAARRNGGPLGKTERCALAVLATAWPTTLPHVCVAIMVGSLLTTGVRLGAAHRELGVAA